VTRTNEGWTCCTASRGKLVLNLSAVRDTLSGVPFGEKSRSRLLPPFEAGPGLSFCFERRSTGPESAFRVSSVPPFENQSVIFVDVRSPAEDARKPLVPTDLRAVSRPRGCPGSAELAGVWASLTWHGRLTVETHGQDGRATSNWSTTGRLGARHKSGSQAARRLSQ